MGKTVCRDVTSKVEVCNDVPEEECDHQQTPVTRYEDDEDCSSTTVRKCLPATRQECHPVVEQVPRQTYETKCTTEYMEECTSGYALAALNALHSKQRVLWSLIF